MKDKIQSHLTSSSYKLLVILDDVWEAENALVYVEVFRSCKIILTTQKSVINSQIETKYPIDIKQMEVDEAIKLLTFRIDGIKILDDSIKAMMYELAEYLYCWPLLLNLVRTQLYIYCTEWKMSPKKAISLATQKLSKSITAFDQTGREKAVKICLDTSLQLLPEQHLRVLQCVVLTIGGLGLYTIRVTVAKVAKISIEQFNICLANLWSHGLIELIDIPMYPTNQSISCIGVHHIVAHYITETMPRKKIFEIIAYDAYMDDIFDMIVQGEKITCNNPGPFCLWSIPSILSFVIRMTSLSAFVAGKFASDSAFSLEAITDQWAMENVYHVIRKDCTLIVSLLTDNKHDDAIEWLEKHFKSHPLLYLPENIIVNNIEIPSYMCKLLVQLTIIHKCIVVLTKVKASAKEIEEFLMIATELAI